MQLKPCVKAMVAYIVPSVLVGFMLGWYVGGGPVASYSGVEELDTNGDAKVDRIDRYAAGRILKAAQDRNFDGRFDCFESYKKGVISDIRTDENFDGRMDSVARYVEGQVVSVQVDVDFNGRFDVVYQFTNGIVFRAEWHINETKTPSKIEHYVHGRKRSQDEDWDGDGIFERRVNFDAYERAIE